MREIEMNESLHNTLVELCKNVEGQELIDMIGEQYIISTINEVVRLISNPCIENDKILSEEYISYDSLYKLRKYYNIDDFFDVNDVKIKESEINMIYSRLLSRIVFKAELDSIRNHVSKNGPLSNDTKIIDYFMPNNILIKISRHYGADEDTVTLSDIADIVDNDEFYRIRSIGNKSANDITEFVDACRGKIKLDNRAVEPTEVTNIFSSLTEKYYGLLKRKEMLTKQLSRYEELSSEKQKVEKEITDFEEKIKSLAKLF